jgi:hypothetical protein
LLVTRHLSLVTAPYESGHADDGTPYIAMEFLEGDLSAKPSRGGVRQ